MKKNNGYKRGKLSKAYMSPQIKLLVKKVTLFRRAGNRNR